MNREFVGKLCDEIELPNDTISAVNEFLDSREMVVSSLAAQVSSGEKMALLLKEMKRYGTKGRLFALCVILSIAEKTYEFYQKHDISDDVFYDTMKDITLWSENYRKKTGNIGVDEIFWLSNHLIPNIFRLGRLQFQMFRVIFPPYTKLKQRMKAPLHTGERCVYVHIPQGEKLTPEECDDAFELADKFFEEHFPKFKFSYFVTETWLIYPENHNFMYSDSNIIQFADRFQIISSCSNDTQAIERLWGEKHSDIEAYAEDTSLQRAAKNYISNGGRLGTAYGIIKS